LRLIWSANSRARVSEPPPAVEGDTSLMVGPDCATAGVTNRTAS